MWPSKAQQGRARGRGFPMTKGGSRWRGKESKGQIGQRGWRADGVRIGSDFKQRLTYSLKKNPAAEGVRGGGPPSRPDKTPF